MLQHVSPWWEKWKTADWLEDFFVVVWLFQGCLIKELIFSPFYLSAEVQSLLWQLKVTTISSDATAKCIGKKNVPKSQQTPGAKSFAAFSFSPSMCSKELFASRWEILRGLVVGPTRCYPDCSTILFHSWLGSLETASHWKPVGYDFKIILMPVLHDFNEK